MESSSRARRWARLLGTAVLGGVLSAGLLAALPAQADTSSDSPDSVSIGQSDDSNSLVSDSDSYGSNTLSPGARSNTLRVGARSNTL